MPVSRSPSGAASLKAPGHVGPLRGHSGLPIGPQWKVSRHMISRVAQMLSFRRDGRSLMFVSRFRPHSFAVCSITPWLVPEPPSQAGCGSAGCGSAACGVALRSGSSQSREAPQRRPN
ncbi:unnamed protein product [Lota lota]